MQQNDSLADGYCSDSKAALQIETGTVLVCLHVISLVGRAPRHQKYDTQAQWTGPHGGRTGKDSLPNPWWPHSGQGLIVDRARQPASSVVASPGRRRCSPRLSACRTFRAAVGGAVTLLTRPLPSAGVSIGMERECQQNDSHTDGHFRACALPSQTMMRAVQRMDMEREGRGGVRSPCVGRLTSWRRFRS